MIATPVLVVIIGYGGSQGRSGAKELVMSTVHGSRHRCGYPRTIRGRILRRMQNRGPDANPVEHGLDLYKSCSKPTHHWNVNVVFSHRMAN